jgi:Maltogenic Amylase, C-terminal domain
LRREHPALRDGRLWHLFSDEGSYVFLREADEERLLVVFNNSAQTRELSIPVNDTPAQGAARASRLIGEASAEPANKEIHIHTPAQSLTIFVLN